MPTDDKFEMTQDEMCRIKEAMKNEEFMKLLIEYTKEIQDPENKKKYEEEIIAMEKQRGNNVRLLSPQSGFVVKTERLSDGMKVFINICTSPEIRECSYTAERRNGKQGTHVSIPHSLTPMREDIDKAGKDCIVFDVCFHPKTYAKALEDIKFRTLLVDSALDTLEKQGKTKVDRKKKRFPKMKYKGMVQTNIIRPDDQKAESDGMPMDDLTKDALDSIMEKNENNQQNGVKHDDQYEHQSNGTVLSPTNESLKVVTPDYKIVHRGYFDMQNYTYEREDRSTTPKELVVEIKLPQAKSATGIDLDIFEKELILDSKEPPYHLEISLPYTVNEVDGQAQFDTAQKILVVTLPVIKPETQFTMEISSEPSIVDVTPPENKTIDYEITNNFDSNDGKVTDETKKIKTDESVSSMLSDKLREVASDINGDVNEDYDDDDTVVVDVEKLREQLGEKLNEISNGVDIEFDTSNFKCFRASSKLPSYCYTQSEEQINLIISIPEVKVVYLSLGFSEQQAYMSYPQNTDDANSPCWELVLRLDEGCYLDKDNCGVDVTNEHMELILRKRHDSSRLWEKFFIGLSEDSLKVEIFDTECIAEDMLKSINRHEIDSIKMEVPSEEGGNALQMEKKLTNLESRLSQLLQSQEESDRAKNEEETKTQSEKNSMNFKESNGVVEDDEDNPEDNNNDESNVTSKLNNVDIHGNNDNSITSNGKHNGSINSPENAFNRQLHGRSLSLGNESSYEGEAILHSILKQSRSDSDYYCDDEEEDELSCSANSFTDSIFDESPAPEPTLGRRRIKSVTFNDEPIIFEFAKLSKRQLKKQMKEERLRQAQQSKGIFSKFSQSAPASTNGTENEQSKGKSKKKDKCEKKNRSYSDGLLQVPNSILTRHKIQKKKKKNKKNKHQDSEESPSNSITDISSTDTDTIEKTTSTETTTTTAETTTTETTTDKETTVLNNTLIFELE